MPYSHDIEYYSTFNKDVYKVIKKKQTDVKGQYTRNSMYENECCCNLMIFNDGYKK